MDASGSSMHEAGHSKPVLRDNPDGMVPGVGMGSWEEGSGWGSHMYTSG